MGGAGISLESVIQRPDLRVSDAAPADVSIRTIVLLTHSTLEQSVREALALIAADGFIVGEPQLIRIESL
jgi:homoserine dehydrogenase